MSKDKDVASTMQLYVAVKSGNIEEVRKILELPNLDINAKDKNGRTPLHIAAKEGFTDIIELLIKSGATVDVLGYEKRTALHEAALNTKYQAVEILLDHGAQVDSKGYGKNIERGWFKNKGELYNTPLFNVLNLWVAKYQDIYDANPDDIPDTDSKVDSDTEDNSDITKNSEQKEDYINTAHTLIEHHASVNVFFNNGHYYYHAIHSATRAGFSTVVEKMIKNDPSLANVQDYLDERWPRDEQYPLEIAIKNKHPETIMVLLKNYANVCAIENVMEKLAKFGEEILKEARHLEEEIKKFVEAFRYVSEHKELPNDWDKDEFCRIFHILDNPSILFNWDEDHFPFMDGLDASEQLTKKMKISVRSFVNNLSFETPISNPRTGLTDEIIHQDDIMKPLGDSDHHDQ
ncbi:MAG: ankyrin repeat domain-containing protein [Candidatus Tisiphia sp.]